MAETEGITQYDVEVQKLGRKEIIALRVSLIRGPRGKKKMLGEAYAKGPNQPFINFKVVNAQDEPAVFEQFIRLLFHRGYLPLRMREVVEYRAKEWQPVSYEGIEDIERVLERERKAPE